MCGVRTVTNLHCLSRKQVLSLPSTGIDVWKEIQRLQAIVSGKSHEPPTEPTPPQLNSDKRTKQELQVLRLNNELLANSLNQKTKDSKEGQQSRKRYAIPLSSSPSQFALYPPNSILSRRLTDILCLSSSESDSLLEVLDPLNWSELNFDAVDWKILASNAIFPSDSLGDVLAHTMGSLVAVTTKLNVFAEVLKIIHNHANQILGKACQYNWHQWDLSAEPILSPQLAALGKSYLHWFKLPSEMLALAQGLSVYQWSSLANESEQSLVMGEKEPFYALSKARLTYVLNTLPIKSSSEEVHPGDCRSFGDFARAVAQLVTSTKRETAIALQRVMGQHDGKKPTLEDLGAQLGVTRERIRQIDVKVRKKLDHVQLPLLHTTIRGILFDSGGTISFLELATRLAQCFDWEPARHADEVSYFCEAQAGWKIIKSAQCLVSMSHPCTNCRNAREALENLLGDEFESLPIESVTEHILHECNCAISRSRFPALRFSEAYIASRLTKDDGIRIYDSELITSDNWSIKYGGPVEFVESVLKLNSGLMHWTDVVLRAKQLRNDLSVRSGRDGRNIKSWLDRAPQARLCERGTYIHEDYWNLPNELLTSICNWIATGLETAHTPCVGVYGVYEYFKQQCLEHGINGYVSLYGKLKEMNDTRLTFPRIPFVYLSEDFSSRIPIGVLLEEYVREDGSFVSRDRLKELITEELLLNPVMTDQYIDLMPNVVKDGKGQCIHLDSLQLSKNDIEPLIEHIHLLLKSSQIVSSRRVFVDKRITCIQLGITGPEMLASVLIELADDEFRVKGGAIEQSNKTDKARRQSLLAYAVHEYLIEMKRPCSYDELEDEFTRNRGFKANRVRNACMHSHVLRASPASVVHLAALEWSKPKETDLIERARTHYRTARSAGHIIAKVRDLLEAENLPHLGNGVIWTDVLLSELLVLSGNFHCIGPSFTSFTAVNNDLNIATIEDVVVYLLRNEYRGVADAEVLKEHLINMGVVSSRSRIDSHFKKGRLASNGMQVYLAEVDSYV